MVRTFAAVEVPDPQRAELLALAEPIAGARWRQAEQLHLTLRFFGELEEEQVAEVGAALEALRAAPFELALGGVGVFPALHAPRVLWVGVRDPAGLAALQGDVARRLEEHGFAREPRPFRPHATLARTTADVDRGAVVEWLARHARFEAEPYVVRDVVLLASELDPGGSRYTELARYPLRAPGS